uniref:Uncharacterized protein n=1 Tax=Cacopsylla melanoneura TaxID=428564 RepID=A0A8D9BPL3_9HEMI
MYCPRRLADSLFKCTWAPSHNTTRLSAWKLPNRPRPRKLCSALWNDCNWATRSTMSWRRWWGMSVARSVRRDGWELRNVQWRACYFGPRIMIVQMIDTGFTCGKSSTTISGRMGSTLIRS